MKANAYQNVQILFIKIHKIILVHFVQITALLATILMIVLLVSQI